MALVQLVEQDLATRVAETWGPADFERLYAQNVDSARRVALAVTGSRQDAEDAVAEGFSRVYLRLSEGGLADHGDLRPFIMTVVRNSAIDLFRRNDRDRRALDQESVASTPDLPSDLVQRSVEHRMIRDAFAGLPDRWRDVLWLTVVEGMPPRTAAPILRMAPNAVSQLAVRARARLAERYVEAHLGPGARSGDCRVVSRHIGRHVTRRLGPAGRARLDSHLGSCAPCAELVDEIDDLGPTLRRSGYALPVVAAVASPAPWWESLRNVYDGVRGVGRSLWLHTARIAHGGPGVPWAAADPMALLPAAGLAVVGLGAALGVVGPPAGEPATRNSIPAAVASAAVDVNGVPAFEYLIGTRISGPALADPTTYPTGLAFVPPPGAAVGGINPSQGGPQPSTTGGSGSLGADLSIPPLGGGDSSAAGLFVGATIPTGGGQEPVAAGVSTGVTLPTGGDGPVAAGVSTGVTLPTDTGQPVELEAAAQATVPGVGALPPATASVDSSLSVQPPGRSVPAAVGAEVAVAGGDGPPVGVGASVDLPYPLG